MSIAPQIILSTYRETKSLRNHSVQLDLEQNIVNQPRHHRDGDQNPEVHPDVHVLEIQSRKDLFAGGDEAGSVWEGLIGGRGAGEGEAGEFEVGEDCDAPFER
jgi:hypothetical protein